MAYNTKSIKKDVDGKPIPQIFDMVKDDYEVLQGRNGAQRVEIYGPDGNPISTTSEKLNVRASELETLLSALGAKDFATQTTLAQILAKLSADPATETTLAGGIVSLLSAIAETASEATAAAILAKLEAGIDTTLTGSIESLTTAPVVGVKTVTATAAEIFAGSSAKANRRKLVVKNEDKILRFRIGTDSVTQQNGFPVEPGAIVEIQFDPGTAVAIYGISEGASLSAAVMEV